MIWYRDAAGKTVGYALSAADAATALSIFLAEMPGMEVVRQDALDKARRRTYRGDALGGAAQVEVAEVADLAGHLIG